MWLDSRIVELFDRFKGDWTKNELIAGELIYPTDYYSLQERRLSKVTRSWEFSSWDARARAYSKARCYSMVIRLCDNSD